MIGGQDIVIPTQDALAALDLAIRAIRRHWKRAVFEDAVTGEALRYSDLSLRGRSEILVFRDSEASRLWEELGADEATNGMLIHLLTLPESLTIVIDNEPSRAIAGLVKAIRLSLTQDLFAGSAGGKAA